MSPIKDVKHLQISLKDILLVTNDFSQENLIARGGFGRVYRGDSRQHGTVAVKRLDIKWGQGHREFVTEVTLLSEYKHENIVSLIGFCKEGGEKVLVYKFETNGSLETQLRKKELTWIQCLRICLDAARGLQYLHDEVGSKQRIIHRDVKTSNILLDENWKAKISDFGLSKMGPANQTNTFLISNVCGTPGYVDPECFCTYTFTQKSDVYSFGVVLFEVLCGKPAYIEKPGEQPHVLANLALDHYKYKTLEKFIDSNLHNQMAKDSFDRFSFIASRCLDRNRERRPVMSVVVDQLEQALNRQLEKEDGNKNLIKQAKENAKLGEPPKDYIHVRARRGQATDTHHSLAERARREKISERMRFLQHLVPGCNKVTGKAVMLDEIINYIQSLQMQVEVDTESRSKLGFDLKGHEASIEHSILNKE